MWRLRTARSSRVLKFVVILPEPTCIWSGHILDMGYSPEVIGNSLQPGTEKTPVDDWERERARRIEPIQGNRNPFIWGEGPSTPPTTPDVVAASNGAIIGNKKSKVYHRPDCPSAAKVSPQHRVRFATEAEAQAAGYRVAANCP